ncbi:cytochrome oxidase putative small subunit CydP [Candidatus Paracaedibacter symbiosus]|uniref:cytochrome oxidase putative small subunit CydP n=1 Tax=Candidatus Paracaedibacter symbiosus TaxID=244582 RepID=UPI0018DB09DF|nr:cytochrome oxidase putative small subunit CydP [Candidatus Paracaedibacter symbiosus]
MRQYFRQISFVLVIKLIAITSLYYCFFSKEHRFKITPQRISEQLIGSHQTWN